MAERKLLESWNMAAIEERIAKMGRELYQFVEDYPVPEGWGYMDFFMFMHQRVYDEAIKLKKAAIASGHSDGALRRKAS